MRSSELARVGAGRAPIETASEDLSCRLQEVQSSTHVDEQGISLSLHLHLQENSFKVGIKKRLDLDLLRYAAI